MMKRLFLSFLALVAIVTGVRAQDMLSTPLTLEAVEAGTINILNPNTLTIEYNKNGGGWTATSSNPISIAVAAGDQVQLRGDNPAYCLITDFSEKPTQITATNDIYVYGNVMSLISSTGFATLTTLPTVGGSGQYDSDNTFAYLFTTSGEYLDPVINTTIHNHPTKDIVLPALNVPRCGYMYMFARCQNLTRAPELPATELGWGCYHQMFCSTSIERAPVLPAATVPNDGYSSMFDKCAKLNYVKCLATDISAQQATFGWLTGVAATGTLVKADGMNDWTVGPLDEWGRIDGVPAGWTVKNASEETVSMTETPLTIEAIEDATTITITNPLALTIEYSTDGGTTWTTSNAAPIIISGINAGQTVQLRGNNAAYASSATKADATTITFDKDCYAYGNVMSLINSTGFETNTTLTGSFAFYGLFYQNTHLLNHATKDLVLPATTLTESCYASMFIGCTGLTKAFTLPATTLATKCYRFMYSGCSNLATACELPATNLAEECYHTMFQATALTSAPALPATTLAKGCYMNLFRACSQLTSAPVLPATTVAESCYEYMFHSTALSTAPVLPATTLADRCYFGMFLNCKNLTTPPALPATTLAQSCYNGMFYGAGLTSIPDLPAATVPTFAYSQMFANCNSLTTVPSLSATRVDKLGYRWMFQDCKGLTASPAILATSLGEDACYYMFQRCENLETAGDLSATELEPAACEFMFSECTKLTKAPKLPATTLATQCYQRMFEECHSLVDAPALPATELAELCYNDMFWNCTSLKNAPVLAATTLADYCYTMMFLGCSSLEKAPDLPAATLTPGCYEHMFMNCTSLNYVKCLATDLGDESSTDGWLTNVAATGTFVKAAGVDWSGKGITERPDTEDPSVIIRFVHGIPEGWTVEEAPATTIGDVNGDGEVGIADIVAVTNVMAGTTTDAATVSRADVNGDNSVGIADIVAITNIMAGN